MRKQAVSSLVRALSSATTAFSGGASSSSAVCASPSSASTLPLNQMPGMPVCASSIMGLRLMSSFGGAASADKKKMLCFQCEQTANGTGCTIVGNCGKTPEVAGLQDLLVFSLKGLGSLAHLARAAGVPDDAEVNSFINRALFSTLTNVNFDDERFQTYIEQSIRLQARLTSRMAKAPAPPANVSWFSETPHPLTWNQETAALLDQRDSHSLSIVELIELSRKTGIASRQEVLGKTVAGLQELVMYGLKGMCAYAAHAEALGGRDPKVYAFVQETLAFLGKVESADVGNLLGTALKVGECNFRVMQLLSESHSSTFGHPEPTEVPLTPVPGKSILVTGHDMHDLHLLLQQTEGKGINVYTHGEMLPAFGYPGLKKFKHLKGHYGGAWYKQKMDFSYFPGAILVTTNCVLEPMSMYKKNIYTTNETGLAGIPHLENKDFTPLIQRALALPGFTEASAKRAAPTEGLKSFTTGFGHHAVLGVAGQVIDAIKTGKLSHIFLVGGCDGHEPQRDYYSQLGKELPKDTLLLTLGCGKFRINNQDFGTLPGTGLPRMLDMGQCNDAYSALVVATELAKAFNTDVNSLPLSLDISWFEQKAVAVLLTLLSLGVKKIRLGPALPAFLTPEAVQVLVDKFELKPADTSNPGLDLKAMLANR